MQYEIKCGEKIYELRLNDEKRQKLRTGDTIKFTVTDETGESIEKRVKNIYRFSDFTELYKALPLKKCGYTDDTIHTASPKKKKKYYSKERQSRYGVLAIEVE